MSVTWDSGSGLGLGALLRRGRLARAAVLPDEARNVVIGEGVVDGPHDVGRLLPGSACLDDGRAQVGRRLYVDPGGGGELGTPTWISLSTYGALALPAHMEPGASVSCTRRT